MKKLTTLTDIDTRRRNIEDDIWAGYDPKGNSIKAQEKELSDYIKAYADEVRLITEQSPRDREVYCKSYLKIHGWID